MTQKNEKSKNIKQLMAEADELMRQINSDAVKNMKEEHRLQFQKYSENLERVKFEFESETGKKETSKTHSGAEGMHEAIQDIVRAFQQLKTYLA
jgi:ferritin-like metal-binding protein YciE